MKEKPLYNVLSELENETKKDFGEIFQSTMEEILKEENIEIEEDEDNEEKTS
jgi:hypothetical protein